MQSKTTRGLRRLLVSTGVISLVLSVAAPAALAGQPEGVGNPQDLATQLLGPLSEDGKKMWVCHATSSETNPFVGIWVSVNARGHLERDDDLDLVACPLELPPVPEDAPVVDTSPGVGDGIGGDQSGTNGDGVGGDQSGTNGDGVGGDQSGDNGVGDGVGGGQSGDNGVGDGVGGGQSGDNGGSEGTGAQSGTDDGSGSTDTSSDEPKKETIISTVTVTRPAPATPATPATPAVPAAPAAPKAPATPAAPATPQAPATPAAQAVTNTPAAPATPAPSVVVSSTSRGNEVLGSITTRTPGGARVTALAATGTSTTVALAALGTVLLLAGLGLQVTARRVQSSAVGA